MHKVAAHSITNCTKCSKFYGGQIKTILIDFYNKHNA